MGRIDLTDYGFSERFQTEAAAYPDLRPARVIAQYRGCYRVASQSGETLAEIAGKLRYAAKTVSDLPAVGDFVLLEPGGSADASAIIGRVLARKSVFLRKSAGKTFSEQLVAANIDTLFLCMSLNNDFSLRRLERYLAIAWESGARPVIVLTKADLAPDAAEKRAAVEGVATGASAVTVSAETENGLSPLLPYVSRGQSVALIGSSGVGKSTIINRLLGDAHIRTNGLRDDDKGRHTTTARELFLLPGGGMLIDTPGMRELGMLEVSDGLERTFSDVDELIAQCRYRDCTHGSEPGCAVLAALADGTLSAGRWESYQRLAKEASYAADAAAARRQKTQKFREIAKINKYNKRK